MGGTQTVGNIMQHTRGFFFCQEKSSKHLEKFEDVY